MINTEGPISKRTHCRITLLKPTAKTSLETVAHTLDKPTCVMPVGGWSESSHPNSHQDETLPLPLEITLRVSSALPLGHELWLH
jgi:hypothetical protein